MAPLVSTDAGKLRGVRIAQLDVFRGIPYAEPPLGERRFVPPAPVKPWSGVRSAEQFGADCMQSASPSHVESEDCLYLNVWAPKRQMRSLPVMVFIHGGAFKQGGASTALYDPSDLARRGVVAVTLNYRLGAFGFLVSLSDGVVGNAGLWDQQLALGWVHRNIAQFGGDASRVTLFGESAGAMSIAVHLTLRSSAHLFAQAIVQSNVASYQYRPLALADKLGTAFKRKLQCASLECLQHEPVGAVLQASLSLQGVPRSVCDFIFWAPVHGRGSGVDAPPTMWAALSSRPGLFGGGGGGGGGGGHVAPPPKPLMLGTNADEGAFFVGAIFSFKMPRLVYLTTLLYLFRASALQVARYYLPLAMTTARRRLAVSNDSAARASYPSVADALAVAVSDFAANFAATQRRRASDVVGRVRRVAAQQQQQQQQQQQEQRQQRRRRRGGWGGIAAVAQATVRAMGGEVLPLDEGDEAAAETVEGYGDDDDDDDDDDDEGGGGGDGGSGGGDSVPREASSGGGGGGGGGGDEWRGRGDHREVFAQILTDYMFRCSVRNASAKWYDWTQRPGHGWRSGGGGGRGKAPPLYLYHFSQPSVHIDDPPVCVGRACHMGELPFVFNRTRRGPPQAGDFSDDEASLAEAMMGQWVSFARAGHPNEPNPNVPGRLPKWPAWRPGAPASMELRWPLDVKSSACDPICDMWDEHVGYSY